MTRTEPQIADNARLSVMDASRLLDCNRRTLWKYADYFRIVPAMNKVNNRCYFTGKQIKQMWRCIL